MAGEGIQCRFTTTIDVAFPEAAPALHFLDGQCRLYRCTTVAIGENVIPTENETAFAFKGQEVLHTAALERAMPTDL